MKFQVFDNGFSIGKYCGSTQPPIITSSGRTLEIQFKSEGDMISEGFIAYFTDTGKHCHFNCI